MIFYGNIDEISLIALFLSDFASPVLASCALHVVFAPKHVHVCTTFMSYATKLCLVLHFDTNGVPEYWDPD